MTKKEISAKNMLLGQILYGKLSYLLSDENNVAAIKEKFGKKDYKSLTEYEVDILRHGYTAENQYVFFADTHLISKEITKDAMKGNDSVVRSKIQESTKYKDAFEEVAIRRLAEGFESGEVSSDILTCDNQELVSRIIAYRGSIEVDIADKELELYRDYLTAVRDLQENVDLPEA